MREQIFNLKVFKPYHFKDIIRNYIGFDFMIDNQLGGALVSFLATDKLMLNGFLCRTKNKSNKAIIHIHGLRGNFYKSKYVKLFAKEALKNGFNFFMIEQRGSYSIIRLAKKKNRKYLSTLQGGSFEKFEECIYDIDGAINFLRKLGINKIYLEGHSTGCQKITYYQYKKKNRKVKALLLFAPADDYNIQKQELGRRFNKIITEAKNIYKKNKNAMMPKPLELQYSIRRFLSFSDSKFVESRIFNYNLPRLKEFSAIKEPILAVFGSEEQYALKPVNVYMNILAKNTNSKLFTPLIIKGANHGFDGHEKALARESINWIRKIEQN
jgi:pimeloyl-ACP methyl ester carboxylesterase